MPISKIFTKQILNKEMDNMCNKDVNWTFLTLKKSQINWTFLTLKIIMGD